MRSHAEVSTNISLTFDCIQSAIDILDSAKAACLSNEIRSQHIASIHHEKQYFEKALLACLTSVCIDDKLNTSRQWLQSWRLHTGALRRQVNNLHLGNLMFKRPRGSSIVVEAAVIGAPVEAVQLAQTALPKTVNSRPSLRSYDEKLDSQLPSLAKTHVKSVKFIRPLDCTLDNENSEHPTQAWLDSTDSERWKPVVRPQPLHLKRHKEHDCDSQVPASAPHKRPVSLQAPPHSPSRKLVCLQTTPKRPSRESIQKSIDDPIAILPKVSSKTTKQPLAPKRPREQTITTRSPKTLGSVELEHIEPSQPDDLLEELLTTLQHQTKSAVNRLEDRSDDEQSKDTVPFPDFEKSEMARDSEDSDSDLGHTFPSMRQQSKYVRCSRNENTHLRQKLDLAKVREREAVEHSMLLDGILAESVAEAQVLRDKENQNKARYQELEQAYEKNTKDTSDFRKEAETREAELDQKIEEITHDNDQLRKRLTRFQSEKAALQQQNEVFAASHGELTKETEESKKALRQARRYQEEAEKQLNDLLVETQAKIEDQDNQIENLSDELRSIRAQKTTALQRIQELEEELNLSSINNAGHSFSSTHDAAQLNGSGQGLFSAPSLQSSRTQPSALAHTTPEESNKAKSLAMLINQAHQIRAKQSTTFVSNLVTNVLRVEPDSQAIARRAIENLTFIDARPVPTEGLVPRDEDWLPISGFLRYQTV